MNYFDHHIGDYAEATSHLSFVEDAAYSRLIRKYYAREKPIPADLKQAQRLIAARTREEKIAVQTVLEEFFSLEADGWHNAVCDENIQKYLEGEPEREVKKANEENRVKRHREERASLFKQLTDAGLHAAWNIGITELRDMVSRISVTAPETETRETVTPPVTAPATPATATQTPDTRHQTPDIKTKDITASGLPNSVGARSTTGEISKTFRAAGVMTNPADPRIIKLAEQQVPIETIKAACETAKEAKPGETIGIGYVVAILERWAKEANEIKVKGATAPAKANGGAPDWEWKKSHAGIDRKGRELNMQPHGGEQYPAYADRIQAEIDKRKAKGQPA